MLDFQPVLSGGGLTLRPLTAADHAALYAAASDPLIWEQHPASQRHDRAVFDPYFDQLISTKRALAITLMDSNTVIGTSSFYIAPDPPQAHSIGFTFITRAHWGGKTNATAKRLMCAHLFQHVDTVWFHIAPNNIRSQKGTAKLGAVRDADRRMDVGSGPEDFVTYKLPRDVFNARQSGT